MSRALLLRSLRLAIACAILISLVPATALAETTEPTVPTGVVIGRTDLGGMTASQARAAIEQTVRAAAQRPIRAKVGTTWFSFTPPAYSLRLDVNWMLGKALSATPTTITAEGASVTTTVSIPASYTIDVAPLNRFLVAARTRIYRAPHNAYPYVRYGRIYVRQARYGRTLNFSASRTTMLRAMAPRSAFATRTTQLLTPVAIRPKIFAGQVGKTILVDRSARTLKLFNGARLIRSYRIAVGTPDHPTPLGHWKVVSRQYMPSWYNPGSAWASGMPNYIGPGPSNPLGTRALALNASGILIHGTSKDFSIGSAASHGCMRMHRWDIEALYPLVPLGTRVWIIP